MAEKEQIGAEEKRRAELAEIRYRARKGPPKECSITNAEVVKLLNLLEAGEARRLSIERWAQSMPGILKMVFRAVVPQEPMPEDMDTAREALYGVRMINFYP